MNRIRDEQRFDLSTREKEILTLLSHGLVDKQVCHELCITRATMGYHKKNLLTKLNSKTVPQAVYKAVLSDVV